MGGDLLCIAALFDEEDTNGKMEEYFVGAVFKMYDFIQRSFHKDGSYAEGQGYYSYATHGTGDCLPALENIFGLDLSGSINGSYREHIWNSNLEKYWYFH